MNKLRKNFRLSANTNIMRIVNHFEREWLNWDENDYLTIIKMKKSGCIGTFKDGIHLFEFGF